jgi:pimeloyl-ACP methyl ester carboxylesterase
MDFRTISSDGQRHVVSVAGEGSDVVLLHGFPDTPYSWSEIETALVAAGWRVTVPWLRGYHHENIVAGRPYDPDTLGRDALELLDALGVSRAVLVGHDWGALIAYVAAALAPDRVRGIVTIAIPHPRVVPRTPSMLWTARHFSALKLPWAARTCRRNDFAYFDRLYRRWAPGWSGVARDESLSHAKQALSDDATLREAIAYYRDLPLAPAQVLRRVGKVPGLIVGGSGETIFADRFARTAALLPPPSKALLVDGAGHWPHREHAGVVLPELLAFLPQLGA